MDSESRIIPAYAGSTRAVRTAHGEPTDHPRIRGEHSLEAAPLRNVKGSSPHTRGARQAHVQSRGALRIIPAYAGSTRRSLARRTRLPDHPRIRGEHPVFPVDLLAGLGSSPHTRGAPIVGGEAVLGLGIIPAYAGSTSSAGVLSRVERDHPRIRGEHQPENDRR